MSSGWRQSDGQGTIIVETFSHANDWLVVGSTQQKAYKKHTLFIYVYVCMRNVWAFFYVAAARKQIKAETGRARESWLSLERESE